ncbi:MAG: DUF3488 and transglutaminase-like domain-containing protein [Deltaproteobacteria bacterium]|nr:DUF3488 and transglutaminase-like domain-containing protein [Deltaproteobacteria bacterium]
MSLGKALRLATVLTGGLAFASVAVGGFLHPLFVALIGAVLVAAYFVPEGRLPSRLVLATALTALPLLLLGFLRGMDLVVVAGTFSSLLLAARVLARESVEDHAQAHLLSVVVLAGAAALSPDVTYLLTFIPFVFALVWALLLAQLRREAGDAALALPVREIVGRRFVLGVVGMTLVALLGTTVLFVIFPRTPISLGFRRPAAAQGSGLSDRVRLAGFGRIKLDDRVVLRVRPVGDAARKRLEGLYWRAHALERYDGESWSASPVEELGDPTRAVLRIPEPQLSAERELAVEVVSDLPTTVLPVPDAATWVRLDGRDGRGRFGMMRGVRAAELRTVGDPTEPWRYTVLLPKSAAPIDRRPPTEAELALPEQDPRVVELARRLLREAGSPERLPAYLEGHLSSEFGYTLELPGADPSLANFLLERKEGHCEYFATAMAVLLRLSGVPARLATGFYSGAWNESGGYQILRQADAHAWVEVWREGAGWVRYDPTPAEGRGTQRGQGWQERLADLWDATQERWSTLVLDYDIRAQIGMVRDMMQAARRFSERIDGSLPGLGRLLGGALVLLGAVLLALFFRHALRSQASREGAPPAAERRAAALLRRWVRGLRRRGLEVAPSDTTEDLLARAAERWPGEPEVLRSLGGLLARYEATRFGGAPLSVADARSLKARGEQTLERLPTDPQRRAA